MIVINPLNAELNPSCHLLILLGDLTFMGTCILSIFQYIYSTRCNVTQFIYIWKLLYMFRVVLPPIIPVIHPSSGAHTTVSAASGICHTVTAICHYRGRVVTGLSVLWVADAKPQHTQTLISL